MLGWITNRKYLWIQMYGMGKICSLPLPRLLIETGTTGADEDV